MTACPAVCPAEPASPVKAVARGRSFRTRPWRGAQALSRFARRARAGVVAALAVLIAAVGPGCTVNPATGKMQFTILSEAEEIRIGEEAAPEFLEEYGGELPDETVGEYVREIGNELAAVSERPDLPWEFHVVDSATINAFVLPGGKVFISRGLLEQMENEAQLAGVLGHEIGHVTAEHIGQQMARRLGVGLGLFAIGAAAQMTDEDWLAALGVGAQVGGTLYLLSFSRNQENEADELGMRYMTELGYNPRGQLQLMQILQREAGRPGGIEFLSTHPLPQTRIDRIEQIIQQRYPDHDDPQRYTFGEQRFESIVPPALADLPPPRHDGDTPAQ